MKGSLTAILLAFCTRQRERKETEVRGERAPEAKLLAFPLAILLAGLGEWVSRVR